MGASRWRPIVAIAIAAPLLASCGRPSVGPAPALSTQSAKSEKACPCLYVALAYTKAFPQGAIGAYPLSAYGDANPTLYIAGGNTNLHTPADVALDSGGNIYVANVARNSVTEYAAGASGNVAPIRSIAGAQTELVSPFGVALDPVNGDLYVANRKGGSSGLGSITVYSPGADGNVAPIASIAGPNTGLHDPASLVLDPRGNIYVPNIKANSITVYAAGSAGDVTPTATIDGSNTKLNEPFQVGLDSSLNIYAANFAPPYSLTVYAAASNGNAAPKQEIIGANTKLDGPDGIVVDVHGNIYAADYDGDRISVWAAGSNGNVTPTRNIMGKKTGIICPSGMEIY